MRRAPHGILSLLTLAAVPACGGGDAVQLDPAKIYASESLAPAHPLAVEWHVELSECAIAGLSRFDDAEFESWRELFCDPELYPGAITCDHMTEERVDDRRRVWTFQAPSGFGPDSFFAVGPLPTPDSVE